MDEPEHPRVIEYDSLDGAQRSRYSEVVASGKPVDEHVVYIMDGVVFDPQSKLGLSREPDTR